MQFVNPALVAKRLDRVLLHTNKLGKNKQNHFANEMGGRALLKRILESGVICKEEDKHGKKCILMEVKSESF